MSNETPLSSEPVPEADTAPPAGPVKKRVRRTYKQIAEDLLNEEELEADGMGNIRKVNAHFTRVQYRRMVDYLELPGKFAELYGPKSALPVSGQVFTRTRAYKNFTDYLNYVRKQEGERGPDLHPASVRERLRTFKNKYFNTYKAARVTGFGVTEEDRRRGITSIDAKLESMCPFYWRMHAIFGVKKPTIPAASEDSHADLTAEFDTTAGSTDHLHLPQRSAPEDTSMTVSDTFPDESYVYDQTDDGLFPPPSIRPADQSTPASRDPAGSRKRTVPNDFSLADDFRLENQDSKMIETLLRFSVEREKRNDQKASRKEEHWAWQKAHAEKLLSWEQQKFAQEAEREEKRREEAMLRREDTSERRELFDKLVEDGKPIEDAIKAVLAVYGPYK
ncbi:hypothetical protein K3495_g5507 [Podosphaera aphanis]|nr:hypothetical protein K3495_g5507 [Podosphaera aphanis]